MSIFKDQFPRIGASGQSTGYTINQSIRFNDDDSAYLSRTHSASNKRTFTFSCWIKRGNLGGYQRLFNAKAKSMETSIDNLRRFEQLVYDNFTRFAK